MIVIAFALHIITFKKKKEMGNKKAFYMLLASSVAIMGLFFNIIKIVEIGIDYMVFFLPITVSFIVTAILRNDFLELKILARDMIFEKNTQGMILLSNENQILDYNEAAYTIFSQQGITLRKDFISDVFAKENSLKNIIITPETKTWKTENADKIHYYDILTTNLQRKNGYVYGKMKTIYEITERQMLHDHMKVLATTDELSGLLNRRAFIHLAEARLEKGPVSNYNFYLLMMDLDFFKKINDTYGHLVGDAVIETFGRLLREFFNCSDLIGRMGGEEFTVLMERDSLDTALYEVEKFRKTVTNYRFNEENEQMHITVSIGLAGMENQNESISLLMTKADKALYAAKNSGRDKTIAYNERMFP
jgi:diguanylate cyclase (GGDEF)-like protein